MAHHRRDMSCVEQSRVAQASNDHQLRKTNEPNDLVADSAPFLPCTRSFYREGARQTTPLYLVNIYSNQLVEAAPGRTATTTGASHTVAIVCLSGWNRYTPRLRACAIYRTPHGPPSLSAPHSVSQAGSNVRFIRPCIRFILRVQPLGESDSTRVLLAEHVVVLRRRRPLLRSFNHYN